MADTLTDAVRDALDDTVIVVQRCKITRSDLTRRVGKGTVGGGCLKMTRIVLHIRRGRKGGGRRARPTSLAAVRGPGFKLTTNACLARSDGSDKSRASFSTERYSRQVIQGSHPESHLGSHLEQRTHQLIPGLLSTVNLRDLPEE